MRIEISRSLLSHLVAEAAASDDEICGLLFGSDSRIEAAQSCANAAADPARRFEIDPAALLAAHRRSRSGGPRVIGHYHSHPGGSPRPSPRDAADAAPDGGLWLIVADGRVTGWRAVVDGAVEGRFDAVTLVACVERQAPAKGLEIQQEPPIP